MMTPTRPWGGYILRLLKPGESLSRPLTSADLPSNPMIFSPSFQGSGVGQTD